MIRLMEIGDLDIVGEIVNGDWKNIYSSYINPDLLFLEGCKKRKKEIEAELLSGSLANYVYEDDRIVKALLTFEKKLLILIKVVLLKSGVFMFCRIFREWELEKACLHLQKNRQCYLVFKKLLFGHLRRISRQFHFISTMDM